MYVGVTRARDSALLTVDTSRPYVHPFLRELVERPDPDEHGSLSAWLQDEECPDLRTRIAARIAEVETLFPELSPVRHDARRARGGGGMLSPGRRHRGE